MSDVHDSLGRRVDIRHRMARAALRVSRWWSWLPLGFALGFALVCFCLSEADEGAMPAAEVQGVYPGKTWEFRAPEELGLSRAKLDALRELVGGRGCVVRHGYMAYTWGDQARSYDVASAMKPVVSTLLFFAIQEGKLAGPDALLADVEPRLRTLNNGKDAGISWRHLASQASGYGLAEAPGAAYAYNDFALALYYDTLTQEVFREPGTQVFRTRLAEALRCEDPFSFEANDRPGRLAVSVRDFARFGLFYLRGGRWAGRQLLRPEFIRTAIGSPIPPELPLTSGREAEMLPGQRSVGGTRNITPVGPGYYSFNWWLNRTNRLGQRLYVDAPPDTYIAGGHGGIRMLWIIPSLDLIVSWNDAEVEDHDRSPGNPDTKCNRAARLIREAVSPASVATAGSSTRLGIDGSRFTLNGQPAFLYGLSYYGGLGATEQVTKRDLDQAQRLHFNWLRVWATWAAFGTNVAAVQADGGPREPFLAKLRWLLAECDRRGLVVDVTLSRGNGAAGPASLQTHAAHCRAVETLLTALRPWRNWYLDLSNERNIQDGRFTSFDELRRLRELARQLDPDRLVTASHGGDLSREDARKYLAEVRVDFLCPHRPRDDGSPAKTEAKTREYLAWMKELGRMAPLHYQEPFRRGYGRWEPQAADYLADLRGARAGGAAGWCFHNGSQRSQPDSQPRRSFDLRQHRLFDQLDSEEMKALADMAAELAPARPLP